MALLEKFIRRQRARRLLSRIQPGSRILEIGSGSGWVKDALNSGMIYIGLDIQPPADIVGDVRNWRSLGLSDGSFDVIIAFEVVEHVDCFKECVDLLRPGGILLCTTPSPRWDWVLNILETIGINQKRTSPHDHLVDLKTVRYFRQREVWSFLILTQWAVLTK
jgi:2-polyprenyl-3-methyl-5-hydroxy-6-metoxy-1,4-benzoquinol methylase